MPQDSQPSSPVTANQIGIADRTPTSDAIALSVQRARALLESWVDRNGWAGFDPYDIRGTGWYLNLARRQALALRASRKVLFTLIDRYPVTARKLAKVEGINTKGMGLFLALFAVVEATDDPAYLKRARSAPTGLAHRFRVIREQVGLSFDCILVSFLRNARVVSSVIG